MTGGCHCGAVRYVVTAAPRRHSLCCCTDCRRSAGAPLVGWAVFPEDALVVTGEVVRYNSSGDVFREFCPRCGTGLFYRSATNFPGEVDVRSGTLDDTESIAPTELVQLDDAPSWLAGLDSLPRHRRYT